MTRAAYGAKWLQQRQQATIPNFIILQSYSIDRSHVCCNWWHKRNNRYELMYVRSTHMHIRFVHCFASVFLDVFTSRSIISHRFACLSQLMALPPIINAIDNTIYGTDTATQARARIATRPSRHKWPNGMYDYNHHLLLLQRRHRDYGIIHV